MPAVAGVVLAAGAGTRFGGPKALALLDGERLVDRAVTTLREGGCAEVVVVQGAAPLDRVDALIVNNPDWASGMGSSLRAALAALAGGRAGAAVILLVDTPWVGAGAVARLLSAAAAVGMGGLGRMADASSGAEASVSGRASGPERFAPGGVSAGGPSISDRVSGREVGPPRGAPGAAGQIPAELSKLQEASPAGGFDDGGEWLTGRASGRGYLAAQATYRGIPGHPVLLARACWDAVAAEALGDRGARAWLRTHRDLVLDVPCDETGDPRDVDRPADLATPPST